MLAGLAAAGETLVTPGYPIDRGHAAIAHRFNALGADVTAVPRRRLSTPLNTGLNTAPGTGLNAAADTGLNAAPASAHSQETRGPPSH